MKQEVEKLRTDCAELRTVITRKEEEILNLKREYESDGTGRDLQVKKETVDSVPPPPQLPPSSSDEKERKLASSSFKEADRTSRSQDVRTGGDNVETNQPRDSSYSSAYSNSESVDVTTDAGKRWAKEEDVPRILVESQVGCKQASYKELTESLSVQQETFSGHTSPITRCRFSTAGTNVASASVDGTVRIWTPDAAASTSRNATIYCGAEIMSLEWENKSDRLLLLGTADRGVKAWNVEAKRVVCDLSTDASFPRILELKCSPTDALFLCVACSQPGNSGQGEDNIGFGSVTVWNMRTWKFMNVLPLGEDPPVVTSVCFNHNGKLVAAGATDGMIRLFGMYSPVVSRGFRRSVGALINVGAKISSLNVHVSVV
ncbi:hypothetical protein R1sor_019014 [Riccia sorocarpa]|uniref:Uncharacterized protein n=1 Tax=Riccia sorocarpa TaxID=122646 RepID=A0ABD3IFJ5_9MARC